MNTNPRNAIILTAGTSSRFVPLSWETPKALLEVRGEILIERQIRQLLEAGISDITIVTGYMSDKFEYLRDKYGVTTVYNEDYARYNNISSIYRVLDRLGNTYILTSDNYYPENPFLENPEEGYYSALYAEGDTNEYCISEDKEGKITSVEIGGKDAWYMYGPVYFDSGFSRKFREIVEEEYDDGSVRQGYWEDLYIRHIDTLPLFIRKRLPGEIYEFDSLDELREFDPSYRNNTRSMIIREIAEVLKCSQEDLTEFKNPRSEGVDSFTFSCRRIPYKYKQGEISMVLSPYGEESIRNYLRIIFPERDVNEASIERIGGMSNKNFKVTVGDNSYVLRVPGNGSEGMVLRANEEFNAHEASRLGINPELVYFNSANGIKLASYVEGAETLDSESIQHKENMDLIAEIYRTLHNSEQEFKNEFNIFREIEKYDRLLENSGGVMYSGWESLRRRVMDLEERLRELDPELKPCHNDGLYENFIKTPDGTVYLLDWEYSGMNDPMADMAALFLEAGFSEENREYFLNRYFCGSVPENTRLKIHYYQILWDYLWSQWTVIKEAQGDDFGSYGQDRFDRARKNLDIADKIN